MMPIDHNIPPSIAMYQLNDKRSSPQPAHLTAYNNIPNQSLFVDSVAARPHYGSTLIEPNANLHQVDNLLYRSEQLTSDELVLLKSIGINTIINLRFFDRDDDKENFAEQLSHANTTYGNNGATVNHSLKLINQPLLTWRIKPKQLAMILHQIQLEQQQGNKVLVHCYHGADRTGVTIAMYRIIRQGWSIKDAKAEMVQGGFGYHSIWKNLERLLTDEKVAEVRAELYQLEGLSASK